MIDDGYTLIRLAVFLLMLVLMGTWEVLAPRRALKISKLLRWSHNFGLVFLNNILLRLLLPAGAIGMASLCQLKGWGLFNVYAIHPLATTIITLIAMDLIIFLQHIMVHAVPLFWRLHRVHHADLDFDVSTGARFHPLEIILSMFIKLATIALLGAPVLAVFIFEILLSSMAMFNHSNIGLPAYVEKLARLLVVTPDMHRIHHSVEDDETNSNFGFNLSCWDRLFSTYRDQVRGGQQDMHIGIRLIDSKESTVSIPAMLKMPFIGDIGGYVINRRKWDG